MQLRPYQVKIIDELRNNMHLGVRSQLVCAPTGSGKTALTAEMLKTASRKGKRCVFFVHRRELIKQAAKAFDKISLPYGIIGSGFPPHTQAPVQIASVGSFNKRRHKYQEFNLCIWDETHHIGARTWENIYKSQPNAYHIGLTATPQRLDGKGLGDYFQRMVSGPTVQWLIKNKFLADYALYMPTKMEMGSVKKTGGDYNRNELNSLFEENSRVIVGSAIKEYSRLLKGKRAVVFAPSVEHSMRVVQEFNAHGIPAAHVDGATKQLERDAELKKFESGKTLVLCNVDLFGEGFDLPSIEAVIMLRPTASLGLYLQQIGRALRPSPGKTKAIILDHVGNVERHGLPCMERQWDLAGHVEKKIKKEREKDLAVKICKKCFAAQPPAPKCIYCGTEFEIVSRQIEEKDGTLEEVDKELLRRQERKKQGRAKTLQDLIELGRSRGYKHPEKWAYYVFKSRRK